jgi:MYXO-CTERM domain-containing protein
MKRLALILLIAVAACDGPAEEIFARESAIMFGQTDPGHPAVGLLKLGAPTCSGTLVGATAALAAARCVGASTGTFVVGGYSYPVTKTSLHASWTTGSVSYDFAVVTLGQAVAGVAPLPLAKAAPKKGDGITLVGFGESGSGVGDSGYRRVASAVIAELGPVTFSFNGAKAGSGNICAGDEGGPSLRVEGGQEQVVGVHSAGSEPCGVSGLDGRVDVVASWIAQQLDPGPAPSKDTTPPTVLISEPGAGAILAASFTVWVTAIDETSLAAIELVVDGQKQGSRSASPATFDVKGLAAGEHTLRADAIDAAGNVGSSETRVVVDAKPEPSPSPSPGPSPSPAPSPSPPPKQPGAFGASCSAAKDCASGLCAADNAAGAKYCTQLCNQLYPCPAGGECLKAGQKWVCALSVPGGGGEGGGKNSAGGRPAEGGLSCSLSGPSAEPPATLLALVAVLALLALRRSR